MTAELPKVKTNGVESSNNTNGHSNIINGIAAQIDHDVISDKESKIDRVLIKPHMEDAGDKVIEELKNVTKKF